MNYKELLAADIKRQIERLIQAGRIVRKADKYVVKLNTSPDSLWLKYHAEKDQRLCPLWGEFYFSFYDMIPKECRNCWKVVMTMTTLEQFMQIKELQENMGISCKCGAETRPFTGKLGTYGAYWYADLYGGLAGGRRLYDKIVNNVTPLMKNCEGSFDIILKRGCTEMEKRFGDSSQWDKAAKIWDPKQQLLDSVFKLEEVDLMQHPIDIIHNLTKIYEYAFEHGDPTYQKFTQQDFAFYPMQYQNEKGFNSEDFLCTLKGNSDDRGCLEIL